MLRIVTTTALTLNTSGGTGEAADPAMYTAKPLTRPFPCTDEQ